MEYVSNLIKRVAGKIAVESKFMNLIEEKASPKHAKFVKGIQQELDDVKESLKKTSMSIGDKLDKIVSLAGEDYLKKNPIDKKKWDIFMNGDFSDCKNAKDVIQELESWVDKHIKILEK
jgi:hypothetical protein